MINKPSSVGVKHKPVLGYSFMFLAVIGFAFVHIGSKLAFTRKKTITNIDCMLFYGIYLSIVFFIYAKLSNVDLALKNVKLKGVFAMLGSFVTSICVNLWLLKAISMISVGKSTLVYSTNPLFSILLQPNNKNCFYLKIMKYFLIFLKCVYKSLLIQIIKFKLCKCCFPFRTCIKNLDIFNFWSFNWSILTICQ